MSDETMNAALTPAPTPEATAPLVAQQPNGNEPLDLAETRDRINILHTQVVEGLRRTTPTIIALGKELLAVKAQLPHGEFQKWFANAKFNFKARTARLYMGLAAAAAKPKGQLLATMEPYLAMKKVGLVKITPVRKIKGEEKGGIAANQEAQQSTARPAAKTTFKIGEISVEDTGEALVWTLAADWRNALANALADERSFEKALQRGLLLKLEPQP